MSVTTAQIRAGLHAALTNVTTGVEATTGQGWNVTAYMLALPQPPSIDIYPDAITFDLANARGLDDRMFVVRAMVAYNQDQGGQERLDVLTATPTGGLKTILETDKTLGGLIQDLRVTEASGYKAYIVEGQPPLLGVEFMVEVYP